MPYTLGSLFDGSGGFPLAGSLCGIEPKWASEIEPYPIAVTRARFPGMRHLGDISKVNGSDIEPVDIITFGSPCQDLSVAGKRAGLKHEANGDEETTRSGLFMEAVRIIKEMREATNGEYPRFALWENVPGAFSSNKGEGFRIVCEELIKIVEPAAVMPAVPPKGWAYADSYVGDGWSLAYRVFDAQYWGVPQRRRRIHLVIDFRGQCARKVLFEREGVRGYFAPVRTSGEGPATHAPGCAGADDWKGEGFDGYNGDLMGEVSSTLGVNGGISTGRNGVIERRRQLGVVASAGFKAGNGAKAGGIGWQDDCAATLSAERNGLEPTVCYASCAPKVRCGVSTGRNGVLVRGGQLDAVGVDSYNLGTTGGIARTLTSSRSDNEHLPCVAYALKSFGEYKDEERSSSLNARDYKGRTGLVCCTAANRADGAVLDQFVVRRLTPVECTRLQGFPDHWGDIEKKDSFTEEEFRFWREVRKTHAIINNRTAKDYTEPQMLVWYNKLHTDGAKYKMWGNGIALPPALYCMQGLMDALTKDEPDDWMT